MKNPKAKSPLDVRRDSFAKKVHKKTDSGKQKSSRQLSSFGDEALELLKKIEEFEALSLKSKIRVK